MSTKVIKVTVCDSCGKSAQAQTVSTPPPGWGRLFVQDGHLTRDLCNECWPKLFDKDDQIAV
jgi:hypothetical protein